MILHPFVSLRSLITETYTRTSGVARLRSQNDLGQKMTSVKKAMPDSLSLEAPYSICLQLLRLLFLLLVGKLFRKNSSIENN